MPTETTVLHSSEETNPILDNLKEKLKAELKEAEKALVAANNKIAALGESPSEEDKAKAIDELTKAKAKVDDLKEKLKAAEGAHEDGEVTPSPVVPGSGAVESPTTGGSETTPTKPKEGEGGKPESPTTGGSETHTGSPAPAEGTHEGGTPSTGETHPTGGDHLEDHAAHAEEGKHEETHEAKPSADEAALKAKAEAAKAEVETAKKNLEKAQAKVEELAKDEHASEEDKAAAAKALVEAKAKVEETTKEAAKAEAAANPANKLGGVVFALASGAYRML